ncbi:hypothetical protein [Dysgonomonas macrotermitis]|uniref:Uncharacterized protein n=1 Tax=Dysgonomonas macrotermitis TaxID=1346286 RepID=A0A1M5IZX5_9BACT|nr:hypothetical protein [Dysgonomonas macrotermitis]SHG33831.1 hypothetical protein SAMN05444362_12171 [Dysgonomonas macrotermitis]
MTTEEILWNAAFERVEEKDDSYNYDEERAKERYYEDKDLFEHFAELFKPKAL